MDNIVEFFQRYAPVLAGLAGAVAIVTGIGGWLQKRAIVKLRAKNEILKKENAELQADCQQLNIEKVGLDRDLNEAVAERSALAADKIAKDAEVAQLKTNLEHEHGLAIATQKRLDRAIEKDGQIWTEKVLANKIAFVPLEERRTPVISVLNLKGGVGKTTVTANLAAALDALGFRVLLLDLDFQGSLTGLFMPVDEQERLYNSEKLLTDFLTLASLKDEFPDLREYSKPILPSQRSAIVPTTDGLAYAEMNLAIRWFLRQGHHRDPRFLLRRELQLNRITNLYDIILLDCPPLLNLCCLNALAASDFLLVPIVPSVQVTARVPVLLKRVREIRENINPDLSVMGIVANRTHWSELTADEQNRLSLLKRECFNILKHEVPQFGTFIRQSKEIRDAEDEHRPLSAGGEMFSSFLELAREVEASLPGYCKRGAAMGQSNPLEVAVS